MEQHDEWMEEKAYLTEKEMEISVFVHEFTEKDLPNQPISENDDEYWCLALSTLCFEAYILGIQPSPRAPFETYQKTYDNFKEVVNQWVNLFKDYEVDICLI